MPAAKEFFCGPEPELEDPLPTHARAVASCRATLLQAYEESVSEVARDEMASGFLDGLADLKIAEAPTAGQPMRVVLLGRTMAGKSTLLSALTGGTVARIGSGAQRTSRDVFAAPVFDLPDVEVVDTPGVGAKDGADDVALAMAEVPGADLVLWVASNDSFQEETAQALREVAFRGKPLIVVLNCRAPLVDDLDREDFLRDPGAVFDQHEGHFKMIRSHLATAGVRPVTEVMLHAEAARQARLSGNPECAVGRASRIDALLAVLARECTEHRASRRVLRDADEVRTQAHALIEVIAEVEHGIRGTVEVSHTMREDQERRAARLVDACQQKTEDDIVRFVGERQGWYQTITDFGPQVSEKWEREQAFLMRDVEAATKKRFSQLARDIDDANAAAELEWSAVARPDLSVEGLHDFRGVWKRKAVGVVVGSSGALASAFLGALAGAPLGGPAGAAIGFVVGGIGAGLSTSLRKKAQSPFKGGAFILEENRKLLRTEIARILTEMQAHALMDVRGLISRIREDLAAAFTLRAEVEAAAIRVADRLANQRRVIGAAVQALDVETAACLLTLDGRPRLAASVERATRLAGVCTAIQVRDEALAEAWLFPPVSPEVLTFGRASPLGPPAAAATSYVLGLTECVPTSTQCSPSGAVVTSSTPVPDQILQAWSATLSDHLSDRVEVVCSSTQRSAFV